MRLKYYILTLRQMSFKKPFVFLLTFITLFTLSLLIFNKKIEPTIKYMSESNARAIALKSANNAVYKNIKDVKYESLITMNKDENGKVTSLTANAMEMNRLATKITTDVQEELENNEESYVRFPIGSFLGESLFGGYGPKIKIRTLPIGDARAEFKSTFESAGINQTRHRIILEIKSDVKILAPFVIDMQTYTNDIVIAETIIVSDTPNSYYDIKGIEGLKVNDTLNMLN